VATPEYPPELLGTYKVNLRDAVGDLVAVFDDWRFLEIKHLVNDPGHCNLRIDGRDSRCDLFEENGIVEVLRKIPGQTLSAMPASLQRDNGWAVEWEGLVSNVYRNTFQNGDEDFVTFCDGYLDMVRRRSVMWDSSVGASESKKVNSPAQTCIYEYVEENCGPGATVAAGREYEGTITGLTVPAWTGSGDNWNGIRAFRNVLETIQEIGNFGSIYFDIIGQGGAAWQFETYTGGQRGQDRTTTGLGADGLNGAGNSPVIFSIKSDNVAQVSYKLVRRASANVVAALGKGQYAARAVEVRDNADAIDPFRVGQREVCRGANSQDDAAELQALGDEWLERMQPVEDFSFVPLRARSTLYGVHYWWGDRITARYKDLERDKQLMGVTIAVTGKGEQFRAWQFETVPRI